MNTTDATRKRKVTVPNFWHDIGSPTRVLAPMVGQSELAFRLLSREYGAHLCYTPMLSAAAVVTEEAYRHEQFDFHASDRPLVVQLCGDDPDQLARAGMLVQEQCDAVEINCGCPQGVARRGHFGAYLLDEPELIERIVRCMRQQLAVPVLVKMRMLPPRQDADPSCRYDATVALALRLEASGCSMITLHGRTRDQKKAGHACDWAAIRAVKVDRDASLYGTP